jgi:hypothetical protein
MQLLHGNDPFENGLDASSKLNQGDALPGRGWDRRRDRFKRFSEKAVQHRPRIQTPLLSPVESGGFYRAFGCQRRFPSGLRFLDPFLSVTRSGSVVHLHFCLRILVPL